LAISHILFKPQNEKALRALSAEVMGKQDGEMMFFIHGWPDNGDMWMPQIAHFQDKYRCVTIDLPHFKRRGDPEWASLWGYTIDELTDIVAATLKVQLENAKKDKCIMIIHDWGSIIGTRVIRKYPELVRAVVIVDVAMMPQTNPSLVNLVMMGFIYQYMLATYFLVGLFPIFGAMFADAAIQRICKIFKSPKYDVPFTASSAYVYFYFQLNSTLECLGLRKPFDKRHGISVRAGAEFPPMPTLFAYAKDKDFKFHSPKFEARLMERKDGSMVVPFGDEKNKGKPEVGHWLAHARPKKFNTAVTQFLEKLEM